MRNASTFLLIPDLSSGNSSRVLDKFWLMYLDLGSGDVAVGYKPL